jgi:hypothetical protein
MVLSLFEQGFKSIFFLLFPRDKKRDEEGERKSTLKVDDNRHPTHYMYLEIRE